MVLRFCLFLLVFSYIGIYFFFPSLFCVLIVFLRISWIPGSESTHLDLEKLFLLSDSLENLNYYGKNKISEPEKM